jgi:hypothetical protein
MFLIPPPIQYRTTYGFITWFRFRCTYVSIWNCFSRYAITARHSTHVGRCLSNRSFRQGRFEKRLHGRGTGSGVVAYWRSLDRSTRVTGARCHYTFGRYHHDIVLRWVQPFTLDFNLSAFSSHYLRPAPIARYLSCHAHPQAFVFVFRRPELFAIRTPNQNSRIAFVFAANQNSDCATPELQHAPCCQHELRRNRLRI